MKTFSSVPLVPAMAAVVGGILLEEFIDINIWWLMAGMLSAIIVLWILHLRTAALTAVFCAVGCVADYVAQPDEFTICELGCYSGVVESVREFEGARQLTVTFDRQNDNDMMPFKCSVFVPSHLPLVEEADRLETIGEPQPLKSMIDLPDERDYAETMRRDGITSSMIVAPSDLHVVGPEPGLLNFMARMRHGMTNRIYGSSLSDEASSFIATVLLGDRRLFDSERQQIYSAAGLSHILALSGMHVGIVAVVVSFMFLWLRLFRMWRFLPLLTVSVVWIYVLLTGMADSAVRAAVMISIGLLARVLQSRSVAMNSLALAAILILVFSPKSLFAPGFQLSFAAVASILLIGDRLIPFDRRRSPWLYRMAAIPSVTLSAVLATAGITAYYFHSFPTWFLLSNLIVPVVFIPLVWMGLFYIVMLIAGFDCSILASAINWSVTVLDNVARLFSSGWMSGAVDVGWFSPWLLVVYGAAFGMFCMSLWRKRAVWGAACVLTAIAGYGLYAVMAIDADGAELYVGRAAYRTDIIMRNGRDVAVLTTAPLHEHDDIRRQLSIRYDDYLRRHGADSLRIVAAEEQFGLFECGFPKISAGGKTLFVASGPEADCYDGRCDFLLVCRGYSGDILKLITHIDADTVILSRDLNVRRHNRYRDELSGLGCAVKSLRENTFSLILQ